MTSTSPSAGSEPASTPSAYRELVLQWGQPLGIEEARARWGQVVAAAEEGAITLVTAESRGYREWAAVVPVREVVEAGRCPVWSLSEARPKLGDLVADATRVPEAAAQVLTRHRRPVAAVVAAVTLVHRPKAGERIDVDRLLRSGGTVVLGFDPGQDGAVDDHGDLLHEPEDPRYTAVARASDGREIGQGAGDSIADALLRLWQPPAHLYSDEPPF
ncbi:hypothetical protein OHS33_39610 (plasmid) [Streptomyces sp. NBC_00536]|uniref:hypothetical protein n=1 Tax=Streptomyces sp. NBC_00536 TaxID=2975769 RepID=UPI002E8241AE|nr:hypothetical protein [Streptomyces sp. NBC_00536]WUC84475.1 hypothetical protein OHS33_39610 [Streptomyces sp. NBC_00536]